MIPLNSITAWRQYAPWINDHQVEQDLVISRALVALYQQPLIVESLAFRGGTALNKLFINPPSRYSEDIDLVQIKPAPIGEAINAIRNALDHWLGYPKWKQKQGRVTLYYQFTTEALPQLPRKLKIEINTEEHLCVLGLAYFPFEVASDWFSGQAMITSFHFNELIGTKLRALYQRKKGRDLFDLWLALDHREFKVAQAILAFQAYLENEDKKITRAQFEANLYEKVLSADFGRDIQLMMTPEIQWDFHVAVARIQQEIIALLPGEKWKGKAASK